MLCKGEMMLKENKMVTAITSVCMLPVVSFIWCYTAWKAHN